MPPTPTPSPLKKFLVPGLILVGLIMVGILLFTKGGTVDQGAALFKGVSKTQQLTPGVMTQTSTTAPLGCLVGSTVPKIKVMSPNGGETFTAGQQITVTWSTCNIPANSSMQILLEEMNPNGTGQGYGLVASGTLNDGSQDLNLFSSVQWNQVSGGAQMQFGKKYRIKIMLTNNSGVVDISDNLFTINSKLVCKPTDPATVRVDSPNGGELYQKGKQITVVWQSCNVSTNTVAMITLDRFDANGNQVAGATLVPSNPFFTSPGTTPTLNDGSEVVTLPTQSQYQPLLDELGLKFKIRINLANGASVSNLQPVAQDYSNNLFTIQ